MKLHLLWRIALWHSIFQLSVFVFLWLERVFPSLVIVFWIRLDCITGALRAKRSASHSFRASCKMPRSPRLAHKAPVMQARIRLMASVWTVSLLPLCDQARPWFRFSKRTSSVAGLALCLVAFSRASLVVLFCGENGTAILSTELWLWALIPAWWIERQSSHTEESSQKSEVGNRKSEVRSGKWEVGSGKWEVRRSSHSALSLNGQKSEIFALCQVWSLKF